MGWRICARDTKLGMSEREQIIAYWRVPAADDCVRFQNVIDQLADQQQAPRFLPHLSFGSFAESEPELDEVLELLRGLELRPVEIAQSPSFTMSLFVRFEPTEHLLRARSAIEAHPGFRTSRDFDPHISLCYGMPKDREEIDAEIETLLDRPVRFDRLVATDIRLPVTTHDDIRLWKRRAVHPISGSN